MHEMEVKMFFYYACATARVSEIVYFRGGYISWAAAALHADVVRMNSVISEISNF